MERMLHYDFDTRMKYYLPKFDNDSEIANDPDVFTNALIDRSQFNKFATMCVNYDLQKKYGLMAQSDIIYCIRNYDDYFAKYGMDLKKREKTISLIYFRIFYSYVSTDIYDISFIALCVGLVTVIVLSTLYDLYLKHRNLPHLCNREHYKRPVGSGSKFESNIAQISETCKAIKLWSSSCIMH